MKRYVIKKIVFARTLEAALKKDKKAKPTDCYLDEEVKQEEKAKPFGYDTGR